MVISWHQPFQRGRNEVTKVPNVISPPSLTFPLRRLRENSCRTGTENVLYDWTWATSSTHSNGGEKAMGGPGRSLAPSTAHRCHSQHQALGILKCCHIMCLFNSPLTITEQWSNLTLHSCTYSKQCHCNTFPALLSSPVPSPIFLYLPVFWKRSSCHTETVALNF